jgi:hypothetical protein
LTPVNLLRPAFSISRRELFHCARIDLHQGSCGLAIQDSGAEFAVRIHGAHCGEPAKIDFS